MSKEIQALGMHAATLYAQIFRDSDGKVWNTSGTPAFETYATANIANYAITMTEEGSTSGYFTGDLPASLVGVPGISVVVRQKVGGSPAESDAPVASGPPNRSAVDLQTIKTQTITCSSAVTVLASVGCSSSLVHTLGKLWTLDGNGNALSSAAVTTAIKTKTDFLPSAMAGANGGVLVAGNNAATMFATLESTGNFIIGGNLNITGSVVANVLQLSAIQVDGSTTLTGPVSIGDLTFTTNIVVTGDVTYSGNVVATAAWPGALATDIVTDGPIGTHDGNVIMVTQLMSLSNNAITSASIQNGSITDAKLSFPAEAAGRPVTFLAAMRRAWEWVTNKQTRNRSTGQLNLLGHDGVTVLETRQQSTAGEVDQMGEGG